MNPRLKRKLLKDKRRITPPLVFGTRHCELMKIQSQLTLKYGTYIPETMIENELLCKLAGVMQPYISIQKKPAKWIDDIHSFSIDSRKGVRSMIPALLAIAFVAAVLLIDRMGGD